MFDNVKPLDQRWEHRKKQIWIALAILVVIGPVMFWYLKNWPEEQVVRRFCRALEEGNYPAAYLIWKPSRSYRNEDFMTDWGPKSEFGKVTTWSLEGSHARGSGVIFTVKLNSKETRIWVEKKDKSLSFPPY